MVCYMTHSPNHFIHGLILCIAWKTSEPESSSTFLRGWVRVSVKKAWHITDIHDMYELSLKLAFIKAGGHATNAITCHHSHNTREFIPHFVVVCDSVVTIMVVKKCGLISS